jgi:hypothetical protein
MTGSFYREGGHWTVGYGQVQRLIRNRKGMGYIACLLRYPHADIHVLDLIYLATTGSSAPVTDQLDNPVASGYRRRLVTLTEELHAAKEAGSEERAAVLEAELDTVAQELRRTFDRRGRLRALGLIAERALINVARTVKLAVEQIGVSHGPLGRHLQASLRTGYFCAYRPAPEFLINWRL